MQNLWKLFKLFKYWNFIVNKLILNFKSKDSKKIKHPKNFLGGKGANLAKMGLLGLPVPPGFTISTKVCDVYYKNNKKLKSIIIKKIINELKIIEKQAKKKFGDLKKSFIGICKIRCKSIDARNARHNS